MFKNLNRGWQSKKKVIGSFEDKAVIVGLSTRFRKSLEALTALKWICARLVGCTFETKATIDERGTTAACAVLIVGSAFVVPSSGSATAKPCTAPTPARRIVGARASFQKCTGTFFDNEAAIFVGHSGQVIDGIGSAHIRIGSSASRKLIFLNALFVLIFRQNVRVLENIQRSARKASQLLIRIGLSKLRLFVRIVPCKVGRTGCASKGIARSTSAPSRRHKHATGTDAIDRTILSPKSLCAHVCTAPTFRSTQKRTRATARIQRIR